MIDKVSRRRLVAGGLALTTASLAASEAAAASPDIMPSHDHDPRTTAEGQIKLGATLDGTPAWWTYSGIIYAVRPALRPLPILAISGCASSWALRQDDGGFRVGGATLSYFRDLGDGAFLDAFYNPVTGARVEVKPNLLTGGGLVYPPDGGSAYAVGQFNAAVVAPGGFGASTPHRPLGDVRWSVGREAVMLTTDRSWNVPVQPQLEAQTQSGDRNDFFDRRVLRMPARYTATTIAPWMAWLAMGETAGHLIWHTSGEKVFSPNDIPADYRAHAAATFDALTTRPDR